MIKKNAKPAGKKRVINNKMNNDVLTGLEEDKPGINKSAATIARCTRFEFEALVHAQGNRVVMANRVASLQQKHGLSYELSVRVLFDDYVAKLLEVSFPASEMIDKEDGDQAKDHRDG